MSLSHCRNCLLLALLLPKSLLPKKILYPLTEALPLWTSVFKAKENFCVRVFGRTIFFDHFEKKVCSNLRGESIKPKFLHIMSKKQGQFRAKEVQLGFFSFRLNYRAFRIFAPFALIWRQIHQICENV